MASGQTDLATKLEVRTERVTETGCWVWTGRLNRNGYGRVYHAGKERMAHRLTYELLVGPIPEGLVLDHVCRVRCCRNPYHLEPVTVQVNTLRGNAVLFGRDK